MCSTHTIAEVCVHSIYKVFSVLAGLFNRRFHIVYCVCVYAFFVSLAHSRRLVVDLPSADADYSIFIFNNIRPSPWALISIWNLDLFFSPLFRLSLSSFQCLLELMGKLLERRQRKNYETLSWWFTRITCIQFIHYIKERICRVRLSLHFFFFFLLLFSCRQAVSVDPTFLSVRVCVCAFGFVSSKMKLTRE